MMHDKKREKPILLVALGGNALIKKGQFGTIEEQFDNLRIPAKQIARLSKSYRIIITHGNGPQVGNLMLQQEYCDTVPKLPLEILVAQTEGHIGYMIESTLDEELMAIGTSDKMLVSLITYVVVDNDDPAFKKPTKPIGPGFSIEEAARLDYPTIDTPKGYRRLVASPLPLTIIEKREIKKLIDLDFIVICCGGGGIPVVRNGRAFNGVDAVIDKDLASACLAKEVGVDIFIMATDIEGAMVHFGTQQQQMLTSVTDEELETYLKQGHFSEGSMMPKVRAAIQFVRQGGKRACITSIDTIEAALNGNGGTEIISSKPPKEWGG